MGVNPIPVAMICTMVYVFQALVLVGGTVDVSASQPDCSIGGLDFLQDVVECAADVAGFLFQFFTFTITGDLPWYIGAVAGVGCTGSLIWAFAQIVRGT